MYPKHNPGAGVPASPDLPEVERRVLELRFMHDLTQREIGERIGYSQMHVSRLLRRALTRLERAALAA